MVPLRVGVLGPVTAWHGEQEVALGQPRQLAVLGVLASRANRVVSRGELIDAVWGDQPPASAEGGIYTYIAGLRRALEPDRPRRVPGRARRVPAQVLVSAGGGYMLRLGPGCLDAAAFERGLDNSRLLRAAGDLAGASRSLREALARWRGIAFAGVPGPFADAERLRLGELRTAAIEERAGLLLAQGRPAEAVPDLTALVAEHPLRERACALLMTALYRCGRQADALRVFRNARQRLAEDLGIDPGTELAQVHQQVLSVDPALNGPPAAGVAVAAADGAGPGSGAGEPDETQLAAPRATAQAVGPLPAQLPPDVAGFAGRAAELARLRAALPAAPVLEGTADESAAAGSDAVSIAVITGTAGVGKTTLAVRFARQAAARFPDGQLYVNLRGFDPSGSPADPGTALRGFLEAFGVPPREVPAGLEAQTGLFRSLIEGKRMLLLLDNARTTDQVRPLLPGSPGCMVLVTSRDQLTGLVAAEGARLFPLGVLAESEARQLLAGRLGADRIAAEPAATAELIRQSAGLPLALSVASALAVTRPGIALAALAAELRDVRVRLDVLETGDVTTDLRTVFSWSCDRLSEPAARMFRLLGLHPGPDVSAPAAASLAGVPLAPARAAMAELCRASLLTEDSDGRFSCHDLLRAYAAEQARETDGDPETGPALRRMLDHYLRTAHGAALSVFPARPRIDLPPALPGVTPETFGGYEQVLGWFQAEHKTLMAAVLLASDRGEDLYCWQLAWSCASMLLRRGQWLDLAAALRTALAAAQRLGDPAGLAQAHNELGNVCCRLGELAEADRNFRCALGLFTSLGDRVNIGLAHHGLCMLLDQQGRYAEALPHAREALRLRRSFGDRAVVAYAENTVGWIYANLGQHAEALRHCMRALELHRESGSRSGAADTLDSIGFAFEGLGDHGQALIHYEQSLALFREIGDPRGEAASLTGLGDAQLALGQAAAARRSWEQALAVLTRMTGADTGPVQGRLARLAAGQAAGSPVQASRSGTAGTAGTAGTGRRDGPLS